MSLETRARRATHGAYATVQGVNPVAQLSELKQQAKTRRRTGVIVAAAVVAVAVVAGGGWFAVANLGASDDPSQTVGPAPSPTVAAAELGDLDPGRYSVPILGTTTVRAEVTVEGEDWAFDRWLQRRDGSTFVLFWTVGRVPAGPCDDSAGVTQLPAGHSTGDLVAALDAQLGTDLSAPTNVVVAGHPGVRVELTATSCAAGNLWSDPNGFPRGNGGGTNQLLIVDAGGATVLVDPQADPADPEIEALIDSISFTNP